VYQVTESPEDARELAAVRVTCQTTLPTIVFPPEGGRKIPSANASADKTDNGCRRRDENSPEIQRAGKLSRSRSTNFRQNKPTPREVSGVVKSRAVNRVIFRWHVLKKKKKKRKQRERERENERRYRLSMGGARADPRLAAEIRAQSQRGFLEISKFKLRRTTLRAMMIMMQSSMRGCPREVARSLAT